MALIPCPECGWNVSTKATACPQCGHPLGSEKEKTTAAGPSTELEPVRLQGFSYDQRKPRELDLYAAGEELVFHQHPPDNPQGGSRVRISLDEARRILAQGGRVLPAVAGAKELRFRVRDDPDEPNEIEEGEVVVDGGKWWVCLRATDLRAALQGLGMNVHWR